MNVNAITLKNILNEIPDDTIIGTLYYGDKVIDFDYCKRVLLLEKDGEYTLLMNPMGTHYFDLTEKEGYKIVKHWQDE